MWYQHLDSIKPHIFKIKTPSGRGTGFLIFLNGGLCGLATAYHVIEHEYEWDEPIKVVHHESKKERLLKSSDRVIFDYPKEDLAFILFSKGDFALEDNTLPLIDTKSHLRQGVEIGWMGFPSMSPNQPCFFAGHVSSYDSKDQSYLWMA